MTRRGEIENDYDWDVTSTPIYFGDPRLNRVFLHHPSQCASVNEYAQACGLSSSELVMMLDDYLDRGVVSLEFFADEVFIHTSPNGRVGHLDVDVPPNLWEQLRSGASIGEAYHHWKLLRDLEKSGWDVEHRTRRILSTIGPIEPAPRLAIGAGGVIVPVVEEDEMLRISGPDGVLDRYEHAGARAVGLVCEEGDLDLVVTAVRKWSLARRYIPTMSVLVLEGPRFNPTLLEGHDSAIQPVAITRDTLGNYFW